MKFSKYFFLVLFFSTLPFVSIFLNPNLPHTSDGGVQIPRMAAYYKAIQDHHFPVRWAGDLNFGYGLPLFNFIYQTPFWISTVFISLGFPLIFTFKVVLFLSFLLSGLFMFLFAREFFHDEKTAFFVTILYQFAPFRLIEVLTRGAVGGVYAYSFFPLILFGISLISQAKINGKFFDVFHKQMVPSFLTISIATALMILSHNSLALVFFATTILFILFFVPSLQKKIMNFIGLFFGLCLSAFYWLPALIEHKYTYGDLFMKNLYKEYFPPIFNFFIPNPLNFAYLRIGEISVHWGIIHSIVLILALHIVFRKSTTVSDYKLFTKKIIIFSYSLILFSLFIMQPISGSVWERLSFLRQFQFPWRFLALVVFATSLLGSVVMKLSWFRKPRIFWAVISIVMLSTVFYWRPTEGYDTYTNEDSFWNFPLNTTYFGETDVIWSAGPATMYPPAIIQVIDGAAEITNFNKRTQTQTFVSNSSASARLVSNTQYFPGWNVYVNNAKTPIQFQDPNWRGLITFDIPQGGNTIAIRFEETGIRKLADMISAVTAILLVCVFIIIQTRKTHE